MLQDLKMTIVVENSASINSGSLWAQHGLSIFLELRFDGGSMNVLWDTGASDDVVLHNLKSLNIDLNTIDLICLSHGHYDHTGGLMGVLQSRSRRTCVLAHPDVFAPKLAARPRLRFIGAPFTRDEAEAAGAVMLVCIDPVDLAPGITTTGEIPRIEAFEIVEGFWTIRAGRRCSDTIPDDQALAIEIPGKGLAVITGCAHAGIINTIRHAQRITGIERLYAVIGGFHLMDAEEERIEATAMALSELDPAIVRPGHCTGSKAISVLQNALGERCRPLFVGDSIRL